MALTTVYLAKKEAIEFLSAQSDSTLFFVCLKSPAFFQTVIRPLTNYQGLISVTRESSIKYLEDLQATDIEQTGGRMEFSIQDIAGKQRAIYFG